MQQTMPRTFSDSAVLALTAVTVVALVGTFSIYKNVMQQVYWREGMTTTSSSWLSDDNTKVYVINLDHEPNKYRLFQENYHQSDLEPYVHRFSAVDGKQTPYDDWLTQDAAEQVVETEQRGYRTHHYELTPGAIGCFLSHYTICKEFLKDGGRATCLVFEDDAAFDADVAMKLRRRLMSVPSNWDILLLGYHRMAGEMVNEGNDIWCKATGFWGTYGYLINKRGAAKFVKEVDRVGIDGQIDAYLSRMQQRGDINIYLLRTPLIVMDYANTGMVTTIQKRLQKEAGVNPFDFKGYLV